MSTALSAERIQAIRDRLAAISTVPWCEDERYPRRVYCDDSLGSCVANCDPSPTPHILTAESIAANTSFIAHAPEDMTYVLAAHDRRDLSAIVELPESEIRRYWRRLKRDDGDVVPSCLPSTLDMLRDLMRAELSDVAPQPIVPPHVSSHREIL